MLTTVASLLCIAVAVIGCLYTIAASLAVRAFRRGPASLPSGDSPAVTVLKPLKGAEPGLYDNLATFVAQDYDGDLQIVLGVADATDPARPIVQRLIREHPQRRIELVVGQRQDEGNGKIANLVAMEAVIAHDVVILSDSDIAVGPRYVRETCDALAAPGVGLVTCLYRGIAGNGFWSSLSAMAIDLHFFPSVLVGMRLGKARPCMGATIALTTATLRAIGGFRAFSAHLADDYAIGEAVRATGQRVALAPWIVDAPLHRAFAIGPREPRAAMGTDHPQHRSGRLRRLDRDASAALRRRRGRRRRRRPAARVARLPRDDGRVSGGAASAGRAAVRRTDASPPARSVARRAVVRRVRRQLRHGRRDVAGPALSRACERHDGRTEACRAVTARDGRSRAAAARRMDDRTGESR